MDTESRLFLECQDCARIVKFLSEAEAQKVAYAPYNYVVYCGPCGEVRARIDDGID